MYYTYMLRCEDNSIYTGITNNLEKRMKEHFSKDKNCAKYTLRHSAKNLEAVWKSENRVLASKLEYYIKRLNKSQKEEIIKNKKLNQEFLPKIDILEYECVQNFENMKF